MIKRLDDELMKKTILDLYWSTLLNKEVLIDDIRAKGYNQEANCVSVVYKQLQRRLDDIDDYLGFKIDTYRPVESVEEGMLAIDVEIFLKKKGSVNMRWLFPETEGESRRGE